MGLAGSERKGGGATLECRGLGFSAGGGLVNGMQVGCLQGKISHPIPPHHCHCTSHQGAGAEGVWGGAQGEESSCQEAVGEGKEIPGVAGVDRFFALTASSATPCMSSSTSRLLILLLLPPPCLSPVLQAEDWNSFSQSLGGWLLSIVRLHETYKAQTATADGEVRSTLKAKREQYNAEDAAREEALEKAIAAVSQVSLGYQIPVGVFCVCRTFMIRDVNPNSVLNYPLPSHISSLTLLALDLSHASTSSPF